jgi:glutamine synthetase|tara:strand:- start:30 stop:1421 length:1392 start_codon:yes stop_codon:yes gene_type:complete
MPTPVYKKVSLASLEECENFFKKNPKTKYLDCIISDLSGIIRGKRLPIKDASKLFTEGMQLCYSTFLLDVSGYCPDADGRGFSDGDPDATYYPIAGSLKLMPWHKDPLAQVMITIQDNTRYSSIIDPRNVLARVWERFDVLNLTINAAFELEFYLFNLRENSYEKPQPPTSKRNKRKNEDTQVYGMSELDDYYDFLEDVNKFCKDQNIPATTVTSEFAPGQFEINLKHTANVLKAADDSALLRRVIKETAINHGYEASFISKPFIDQVGSGMHVHISLLDINNKNIFESSKEEGSKDLSYAVAGLQKTMYDAFSIFASNKNSYRRFEPDMFVPVNTSWGPNNRSVAFRIPTGEKHSRRIEHRVAGAESNPYLVLAAILAGIHYGLKNKLNPISKARIDNACLQSDPEMPKNIEQALNLLESSKILKDYLTDEYVKMFVNIKRKEQEFFNSEISDLEYKWYLNL